MIISKLINKWRNTNKLFKSHFILVFILVLMITISVNYYFNLINKYESQIYDCKVRLANKDNSYAKDRIDKYINQLELDKISKESHDIVDSMNTDNNDLVSQNIHQNVPSGHSFKSYTYYTSLSQHSLQGKLQQFAYTDENGLRKVGEYYCAALGSYYAGSIGDKYIVTLSTGNKFKMILCDVKADIHTDTNHQFTKNNGCVIEFYVDKTKLNNRVKYSGNVSSISGFEGDVVSIIKE